MTRVARWPLRSSSRLCVKLDQDPSVTPRALNPPGRGGLRQGRRHDCHEQKNSCPPHRSSSNYVVGAKDPQGR
jgi:hypothetical protein